MSVEGNGDLFVKDFSLDKKFKIKDLDVHYGENFKIFHNELFKKLKSDKKGLVLLHGSPGTGKTYYLRYLLQCLSKTDKKVLILCDGVDKCTEFNLFSKYVKVGDFIMAHDYSVSYQYFEDNLKNKKWNWCQITEDDIKDSITKFRLVDYNDINFSQEMWVCKTKKENTKKILL
jgi:Cdc6-like AAA superfamily ATPase